MTQYKIESDRLEGFSVGAVVEESAFAEGTNVAALVEGGFISPAAKRAADKQSTSEEK